MNGSVAKLWIKVNLLIYKHNIFFEHTLAQQDSTEFFKKIIERLEVQEIFQYEKYTSYEIEDAELYEPLAGDKKWETENIFKI